VGQRVKGAIRLCLVFTGQGSEFPEMTAELYAANAVFRTAMEDCAQVPSKPYTRNFKFVIPNPKSLKN
jgi:acyl transferase domain-containing protein